MMLMNKATALMTIALPSVSPERVISIRPVLVNHSDRLMMAPRFLRIGITLTLSFYYGWQSDNNRKGYQGTAGANWNR